VAKISGKRSERVRELWMMTAVNRQRKIKRHA